MQIQEITDKKQLNDFVGSQPMSQFLQSWQWGEFQNRVGGGVSRVGAVDQDSLVASAQIIIKDLPMGKKYLYCGRGPIVADGIEKNEATTLLVGKIKDLADQVGAMFLRFDALWKLDIKHEKLAKTLDVQPPKTLMLDLSKDEDRLLKEIHQKTRYNINLALKKGVKIVQADKTRFEEFWSLLDQSSGRDKFSPHGRNYYRAMIEAPDDLIKLFFAEYKGKPLATALVSFFGDTATYLHGGSSDQERNVMAPHLLQWHLIKLAKADGKKYYDFYGIDGSKWPGVTRFKTGFGGFEVNYPGTFDLVYDESWYKIYKMVRKVRRTF